MQSGSGIQELMAAETRASQIVAEARMGELKQRWTEEEALSSWNDLAVIVEAR